MKKKKSFLEKEEVWKSSCFLNTLRVASVEREEGRNAKNNFRKHKGFNLFIIISFIHKGLSTFG